MTASIAGVLVRPAFIGTSTGRLMIAVLGGLADVERDLIRTRTAEGRSRAQARGRTVRHGSPYLIIA
jgi:DNA invertase Pin-like site-specific DNA recombinase